MTDRNDSDLPNQPVQITDVQTETQSTSPSYFNIRESAADILFNRKRCPHLSLNPLNGNSLY